MALAHQTKFSIVMCAGPHAQSPPQTGAGERLTQIAENLAACLMRLRARKSSQLSADPGECSLDVPGHLSGHVGGGGRIA